MIKREMQCQSNNFRPQFTDEECITVYLWGISQRRFEQKAIYNDTKNHLSEWFPKLPRYQAFSRRCAALAPAFRALAERWMEQAAPSGEAQTIYLVDSCPIMLAQRSCSGYAKVAGDFCAKSYHSTRKEWYYGVKLHAFTQKRTAKLPVPAALILFLIKLFNFIKKTPPGGVVVSAIFGMENHGNPSHYDLHIENFNSFELKFSIEYQYECVLCRCS